MKTPREIQLEELVNALQVQLIDVEACNFHLSYLLGEIRRKSAFAIPKTLRIETTSESEFCKRHWRMAKYISIIQNKLGLTPASKISQKKSFE